MACTHTTSACMGALLKRPNWLQPQHQAHVCNNMVPCVACYKLQNATSAASCVHTAPSALFGCAGELWDRTRLLDWSYAGVLYGDYKLPKLPIMANLKTVFGARGDGVTDDTAAFELALATLPQQGTILVPKGVYVITRVNPPGRQPLLRAPAPPPRGRRLLWFWHH